MNEREGKREFARLLLQYPGDPRRCAIILCAAVGIIDTNQITSIATRWVNDPDVIADRQEMLDEQGEDAFLPSRADVARKLWAIAETAGVEPDDQIKALKEYAALRGFVNKDAPGITVNVNRVMMIKDHGSDDEWERNLLTQQSKLIEHVA